MAAPLSRAFRWLAAALLAVLLAPAWADGTLGRPAIVVERPGQCIAPAAEMRRNHMVMLRHQRDITVREGVRGAPASLKACVDCHASRENGSVIGSDRNFCQGCHRFAAVKLDCFECHQARRSAPLAAAPTQEHAP
jgi:hypothetical protein